jgi:hypothetical protein
MNDERTPKGWRELNAYSVYVNQDMTRIIVCGDPQDEDEEECNHNCDYMGCTSVSHVILRADLANVLNGE